MRIYKYKHAREVPSTSTNVQHNILNTENPKLITRLTRATACHHTDKKTHFPHNISVALSPFHAYHQIQGQGHEISLVHNRHSHNYSF